MTDADFFQQLQNFIPKGSPIGIFYNQDGSINREKTLALPEFAEFKEKA